MLHVLKKVRHGLRKPPGYILSRIVVEAKAEAERYLGPRRSKHFDLAALLTQTRSNSLMSLWKRLQEQPYIATKTATRLEYEQLCEGDFGVETRARVLSSALLEREFFNREYIEKLFEDHRSGRRDCSLYIWTLFNLTSWYDYWVEQRVVVTA